MLNGEASLDWMLLCLIPSLRPSSSTRMLHMAFKICAAASSDGTLPPEEKVSLARLYSFCILFSGSEDGWACGAVEYEGGDDRGCCWLDLLESLSPLFFSRGPAGMKVWWTPKATVLAAWDEPGDALIMAPGFFECPFAWWSHHLLGNRDLPAV